MSSVKKVGPPVPPRPTAKSRSCSPTVTQTPVKSGRTIIYKSPSLEEKNKTDSSSLKHQNQVTQVARAVPIPKPRLISPMHTMKPNDLPPQQRQTTVATENNGDLSRISLKSAGIEVKSNLKSIDLIKSDSNNEQHAMQSASNNVSNVNGKSETASVDLQTIEFTNQFMDEMVQSMSKNRAFGYEKLPCRPEPEGKEGYGYREGSDSSNSDSYISACSTQNNSLKSGGEKSFEEKLSEKKSIFSEMLISEMIASHPPLLVSPNQKVVTTTVHPISQIQRASISKQMSSMSPVSSIEHSPPNSHSTPKSMPSPSLTSSSSSSLKRERFPSVSSSSNDVSPQGTQRAPRIRTSDWIEVGDNGKEVVMTSCHISLEDSGLEDEERLDDASSGVGDSWDSIKDSEDRVKLALPGLPPLPKSLSGFQEAPMNDVPSEEISRPSQTPQTQTSTLDTQLATLRREMYGLRQLDLSLLSQLWTLNESIQEFRTIVQEQEALSPPSPSPSNSGSEVPSSEDESPVICRPVVSSHPSQMLQLHRKKTPNRARGAPPPPPPRDNRKSQLSQR